MNKAGTQKLTTERLILRRFKIEDADDMFNNWAADPDVNTFMTWPAHANVEVSRKVTGEWISHYPEGNYFNWAIEYNETGSVIGSISVVNLNEDISACEIGYCMSKSYWGLGIMPEALKAVMAYLFDVVGMNRIGAKHDVNNAKSGRVMDKAGMKTEGTIRASGRNNQGIVDEVWHSMIRSDRTSPDELNISLEDYEWPMESVDHDRSVVRAVCFDDAGYFYFVRAERDDEFGVSTLIETSGGGVEEGEDLVTAIKRELKEELGAEVEVVRKIGIVSDYYNLIHRHNINHYFLCKILSFGERALTEQEIEDYHLSTLKMTYDEALADYDMRRDSRLGRLIANREMPVLMKARELLGI